MTNTTDADMSRDGRVQRQGGEGLGVSLQLSLNVSASAEVLDYYSPNLDLGSAALGCDFVHRDLSRWQTARVLLCNKLCRRLGFWRWWLKTGGGQRRSYSGGGVTDEVAAQLALGKACLSALTPIRVGSTCYSPFQGLASRDRQPPALGKSASQKHCDSLEARTWDANPFSSSP
jgi:hypothetical protein